MSLPMEEHIAPYEEVFPPDTPLQQRQKLNLNLIKFLEQNLQEMQRNKLKHTMEKQPAKSTLWESLQTTKFLQ